MSEQQNFESLWSEAANKADPLVEEGADTVFAAAVRLQGQIMVPFELTVVLTEKTRGPDGPGQLYNYLAKTARRHISALAEELMARRDITGVEMTGALGYNPLPTIIEATRDAIDDLPEADWQDLSADEREELLTGGDFTARKVQDTSPFINDVLAQMGLSHDDIDDLDLEEDDDSEE